MGLHAIKAFVSFAIHCVLALLLGGLFGFFVTVKFSPQVLLATTNYSGAEDVTNFFNSKKIETEKFSASAIAGYINNAIFEDFKLQNKSYGATLQTSFLEIEGDCLKASLDISTPILGATSMRRLMFFADVNDGKLRLLTAKFGDAKIPNFIASIVFYSIKSSYFKGVNTSLAAENLSKVNIVKIENSAIILSK